MGGARRPPHFPPGSRGVRHSVHSLSGYHGATHSVHSLSGYHGLTRSVHSRLQLTDLGGDVGRRDEALAHQDGVGSGRGHASDLIAREESALADDDGDRKSTRLNSSHVRISYAVFCLEKE